MIDDGKLQEDVDLLASRSNGDLVVAEDFNKFKDDLRLILTRLIAAVENHEEIC